MGSIKNEVSAEATLTAQGRLAIPKEVRQAAGLEPGAKVYITVQGDGGPMLMETRTQKTHRLRATLAEQLGADSPSLADELADDRRREAQRESGTA